MCCGCQLSYLVPNMDFQNTILLSLHVYPSENIAKSSVIRNFEKPENQILTHRSKKILKTVLFHVYTSLKKLFSPLVQHFLPGFQITLVTPVHSEKTPLTTQLKAVRSFVNFFLKIEQSLDFQTLSAEQHLKQCH